MSDLRYRVLLADTLDEPGLEVLRRGGCELIDAANEERSLLVDRIGGCHGLIVRSRTKVSRELLAAAGDLRVIGCSGIGVDNVDLEAATERDIAVVNTPTANVLAATELTMTLILALARRLTPAAESLAAGEWERRRFRGFELAGKTLGIVGFGRIGRQVASRGAAFGMMVVATDPYLEPAVAHRFAVEFLPLQELLAVADVVTIHTPLSPETRHLIDAERLGWMKPGAILVNCARGGVLDEGAVFEALEAGELAGVGLDVHEHEPPRDLRLVRHPRVVATPHIGAQTEEAQQRVALEVAGRLLAVLEGSGAVDTVNLPARLLDRRTRAALFLARRLGALATSLLGVADDRAGNGGKGTNLAVEIRGFDEGTAPRLTNAVLGSALGVVAGVEVGDLDAVETAKREGLSISWRSAPAVSAGERVVAITAARGAVSIRIAGSSDRAGNPLLTGLGANEVSIPLAGPLLLVATKGEQSPLSVILSALDKEGCEVTALAGSAKEGDGGRWLAFALTSAPS
ncbi:MAG TPA: hydroxyacid dehydrogenase, partial [Thermoanaerobaculia bacterium]|nr:hydroxyacid dehydrogenase [Thermoanaerobaculia bacterium]